MATLLVLFFRQPKDRSWEDPDLFTLESRIQALEMALADQRILMGTLKNQNKADMGYFKQEMKDIHLAMGDLTQVPSTGLRHRRATIG